MRQGLATFVLTRGALAAAVLALPACQLARLNPGRMSAVMVGAHAGLFKQVRGHWPASRAELQTFPCPRLDDTKLAEVHLGGPAATPDDDGCRFLATLPYDVEMKPVASHLELVVQDSGDRLVCALTVVVPDKHRNVDGAPMARLHINAFRCPGEGKQSDEFIQGVPRTR